MKVYTYNKGFYILILITSVIYGRDFVAQYFLFYVL